MFSVVYMYNFSTIPSDYEWRAVAVLSMHKVLKVFERMASSKCRSSSEGRGMRNLAMNSFTSTPLVGSLKGTLHPPK